MTTARIVLSALFLGACSDRDEPSHSGSEPAEYPGIPLVPLSGQPPYDEQYAWIRLDYAGDLDGLPSNKLSVAVDLVTGDYAGEVFIDLLDEGGPLDDCAVWSGISGDQDFGDLALAGPLEVAIGSAVHTLHPDPEAAYYSGWTSYLSKIEPEWGAEVAVSLEGTDEVPGFDLDPLTRFPAGPVILSNPIADSGTILSPESSTLVWNGLDADPVRVQIQAEAYPGFNVHCNVITDDGEFTVPEHVFEWMGTDVFQMQASVVRDHSRAVEIEPGKWALFLVRSWSAVDWWVDPTL